MDAVKQTALVVLLALVFSFYMNRFSPSFLEPTVNAQENKLPLSNDEGIILIQSDVSLIEPEKPFQLSVTINNKSENNLFLRSYPYLILSKGDSSQETKEGSEDRFYSIVDVDREAEYRKWDSLASGESICFDVDLTNLKWGIERSAFTPSESIFKAVPKGEYTLYLRLPVRLTENKDEKSQTIYSNKIKVTIK